MFGLLDLNNAYASMESVFDPSLRGRAVVVASSGDGCAIARSAEAKALGVKMGQPLHQIEPQIRRQLVVRSANFTLYGSLSNRVYQLVSQSVPAVERYSVDELFLDLSGIPKRAAFAAELRDRVHQYTGLANCVGIGGPTKTLAKLANRIAKRGAGVVDLSDPATHREALASVEIGDVWGVGRRWAPRLQALGIQTALDLRDAPPDQIGKLFGVVLLRTQRELQGRPCAGLVPEDPDRRTLMVSRTFGSRVRDPGMVAEAVASFAVRAAEKAREGGLVAGAIQVFACTDAFRRDLPQHFPSLTYTLPSHTADTRLLLRVARRIVAHLLEPRYEYKKAGVMLLDLVRPEQLPGDLFNPAAVAGDEGLMSAVDAINRRFGRGALKFAAAAGDADVPWRSRQRNLSPCYTTRWADLPRVTC